MLLTTTLEADHVARIVAMESDAQFDGNLITDGVSHVGRSRDGRHKLRFTLKVKNSFKLGARTSYSGRHMPAASWQSHRDVFRAIFAADPQAKLHTALADYNGEADFLAHFERTGDHNVGSRMNPRSIRECAV